MKYNFTQCNIVNLPSGEPLQDERGETITVASVALLACFQSIEGEQVSGADKVVRYKIGKKLCENDLSNVDLTSEEVTTIKNACGARYAPLVVGQVYDFLEQS